MRQSRAFAGNFSTPKRIELTAASMLSMAVTGCGPGEDEPAPTVSIAAASSGDVAGAAPNPAQAKVELRMVRLQTTEGNILIELAADQARGTVENFLNYVREGFYSGTTFHYVEPGRMILGGGFTADDQARPVRGTIRNEAHNSLKHERGTVAMARQPGHIDSATSQFFINLADSPEFNHYGESAVEYGYCVFGCVVEGLEVAERISQRPTANRGGDHSQTPSAPVLIETVSLGR